jgi:hypothetical protein
MKTQQIKGQIRYNLLQWKDAELYEKVAEELEIKELQHSIMVLNKIIYNLVIL